MKRLLSLGILLLSLSLVDAARADTIHLKNGRQMTGIITRENPDSIELAIGIGTVKFYTNQIARVTRSAPEEAKAMADSWDAQSKQEAAGAEKEKDASLNPRNEIKGARMGDHLLVNAVINSKVKARLLVDTGASIIMLSKIKAKELGIEIKDGEKADAKLKLADGKEVEGKLIDLRSVTLDNAKVRDVAAAVVLNDEPFKDFDGLLGMSYLKFFKFEIDLQGEKLVLQEPEEEGSASSK